MLIICIIESKFPNISTNKIPNIPDIRGVLNQSILNPLDFLYRYEKLEENEKIEADENAKKVGIARLYEILEGIPESFETRATRYCQK